MNEETKQKSAIKRLGEQIVGVFKWVWDQWQTNPLGSILVVVLLLLLAWITWKTAQLGNLGFDGYYSDPESGYHRGKTYWDWMELLIIPIVLALGAWGLNYSARKNEQKIADDRRNQATLEAYFDRMEDLLKRGLADKKSEAVSFHGFLAAIWYIFRPTVKKDASEKEILSTIARTRTLAVLRSLDGKRRGQVVQFLYESGLIGGKQCMVKLSGANLQEADLGFGSLTRANLQGADLSKVNLFAAILYEANLISANLTKANLSKANLMDATLHLAILNEADLTRANLYGAKVTIERLAQAASLAGATLPDGTKLSDENWRVEFDEWRNEQD